MVRLVERIVKMIVHGTLAWCFKVLLLFIDSKCYE
jgi:hypothetical protein